MGSDAKLSIKGSAHDFNSGLPPPPEGMSEIHLPPRLSVRWWDFKHWPWRSQPCQRALFLFIFILTVWRRDFWLRRCINVCSSSFKLPDAAEAQPHIDRTVRLCSRTVEGGPSEQRHSCLLPHGLCRLKTTDSAEANTSCSEISPLFFLFLLKLKFFQYNQEKEQKKN